MKGSLCIILRHLPTICHILTALTNDAILAEKYFLFYSNNTFKNHCYQVYNLDFPAQELSGRF